MKCSQIVDREQSSGPVFHLFEPANGHDKPGNHTHKPDQTAQHLHPPSAHLSIRMEFCLNEPLATLRNKVNQIEQYHFRYLLWQDKVLAKATIAGSKARF